jgi:FkbM family methyltransferase
MENTAEYIAHKLIGTPLETPARQLRDWREIWYKRTGQHPESHAVWAEKDDMEQALARVLRPDSNGIDVGCHLGAVLSRLYHYAPQGQHMAFEPTPYKAAWLRRKYPQADIRELALSDTPGEATFHTYPNRSGFNSLQPNRWMEDEVRSFRVRCERLSEIIPQDRSIDFLKIDVEGAERLVLRGASELIARCRPTIVFECTLGGLEAFDFSPCDLYKDLTKALGYDIHTFAGYLKNDVPLSEERFTQLQHPPIQALNFLAVPR